MKKVGLGILSAGALLLAVMLLKTASFTSRQIAVEPVAAAEVDGQRAARNLSRAIQFKTFSDQAPRKSNSAEFKAFHGFLEEAFPRIHRNLQREIIADNSLLYTWKGSDDSLAPILLTAHLDVVPVAADTEDDWTYPPFAGRIADNYIWGRGSLDDKGCLLATLEAVEVLLGDGYIPRRTLYLAYGHDEEDGGRGGAAKIAALLQSRKVKAEWILDEGGSITVGIVPGVSQPVALVGIAEKGYLTLELTVEQEGGHSSMPPPRSAIGILCSAIHHLQNDPFPAKLEGPTRELFEFAGPEMSFGMKFLFANQWLLGPLIKIQLAKANSTNAGIRTTFAPTIIAGGTKENVLPQAARAVVNFRLYPGDSIGYVVEHVKKAIDDPRVQVRPSGPDANEASPVSAVDSPSFQVLQRTVGQIFPEAIVAPFLMLAGTDTKHYAGLSDNIFRFLPMYLTSADLERIHGTNERLGVDNYEKFIAFYIQMIRNSNKILE
ncbi:MAG: M20 family peptidase [Desulfobacterales bacterium]|nr:MAG: M20 family peptidase [Desulfobacterales bacterium]